MPALTNPDIGAVHRLLTFVKSRRTAGEQLRQVRPSTWPTRNLFSWTFSRLSTTVKDAFLAYVIEAAGEKIVIQDDESINWQGVIITRNIDIVQTHRNTAPTDCPDNSLWQVSFDFEGVEV